jgi:hypothetical protein
LILAVEDEIKSLKLLLGCIKADVFWNAADPRDGNPVNSEYATQPNEVPPAPSPFSTWPAVPTDEVGPNTSTPFISAGGSNVALIHLIPPALR